MTDIEKLRRDIDTLKESIALNRMNLAQRTQTEIQEILQHTGWCIAELERLKADLKQIELSN